MTTWPDMHLPPINLYNAPVRGKDAIVTDYEEFEQLWIDVALSPGDAPCWYTSEGREAAKWAWQAARSEAFVLRKQAEAIERLFNECSIKSMSGTYIWSEGVINEAGILRQRADELDQKK